MFNKWLRVLCIFVLLVMAQECFAQMNKESVEEQLLTMDFNEAEISDVLRILSKEYKLNIIAGKDIVGKVTVSFAGVKLDDALSSILKTNGYYYVREGNIIRVIRLGQAGVERITRIFALKHVDAKDVRESLSGMVTQYGVIQIMTRSAGIGSEKTEGRSNVLIITDIPSNVKKLEQIVSQLDKPVPQVMIQAKIMEVSVNDEKDLGINWNLEASVGGASRATTFPFDNKKALHSRYLQGAFPATTSADFTFGTLSFANLTAALKLLETKVNTNILSSPKITTLDNQEASIHVGDIVPIPKYTYNDERGAWEITGYEEQEVGITLKVTPHVSGEYIVMTVFPEISEITGWVKGPSGENEKPMLSTRRTDTQVKVKNGETIVIAGLIKDKEIKTVSKVPILGDIPILGLLFRRHNPVKEKIDLLIFLTPYILTDEKAKEKL
ncbi:MAG: secretin and TonB N-terminal domain-containing protein [Candidatus Theseobacter exili]|nr:secretin and TonB N-terminal domain-containing protein [Candidatus Theseobacter exili]